MLKRILSFLLILCMLSGMLLFASAEEPETVPAEPETVTEEPVATEPEAVTEETIPSEPEDATEETVPSEPEDEEDELAPTPDAISTDEDEELRLTEELADGEQDFAETFGARLYVAKAPAAGLDGTVAVSFAPLTCIGTLYLPGIADTSALYLSWDDAELTVSKGKTVYESGTAPIAAAGDCVTYLFTKGLFRALVTVRTVQGSPGVAGMFLSLDESLGSIDAMNADPEHETPCYGSVAFDGQELPYMSMKGRGNSTWVFPKKPYNLTFYKAADYDKKQKVELIPGVKAKKWSLLANYLDNSLLRNKVGLDLASDLGIGLPSRFVDLWMNGEYLGNYTLTPKSDYQAPDGGYFLENDNYLSADDPQFRLPGMQEPGIADGFYNFISVKDIGDDAADAGIGAAEIEAYMLEAWAALRDYGSEAYQDYFDLDSWAKQYLMYELTKTYDVFSGSLFFHRDGLDAEDKLIAGPAWDMDNTMGRTLIKLMSGVTMYNQLTAEGWYNDSVGLAVSDAPVCLLQELEKHPSFVQHMSEIYNEYRWAFERITANIDEQRWQLALSADMNNERWGLHHIGTYFAPTPVVFGTGKYTLYYEPTVTWDNYVNNMSTFVTKRVQFLSDHLCAEAPYGAIEGETTVQSGDTLELRAALTAGNSRNGYVWQRKGADGWENIEGADGAVLRLTVTEADDGVKLRCVVQSYGPTICMEHVRGVRATAGATLDSVKLKVVPHGHDYADTVVAPTCEAAGYTEHVCRCGDSYRDGLTEPLGHEYKDGFCVRCGGKDPKAHYETRTEKTALAEGTLTVTMGRQTLGEFTFGKLDGGWTIRGAEGNYLAADGRSVVLVDTPFAWQYSGGVFRTEQRVSYTALGRLLGVTHSERLWLTHSGSRLTLSLFAGTKAEFARSYDVLITS